MSFTCKRHWKIPFISNLKMPACASKLDVLELATLREIKKDTIPTRKKMLNVCLFQKIASIDLNPGFDQDFSLIFLVKHCTRPHIRFLFHQLSATVPTERFTSQLNKKYHLQPKFETSVRSIKLISWIFGLFFENSHK